MSNYTHILVAVDFSRESDAVADKASALATAFNGRLSMVHVVEYQGLNFIPDFPIPEDVELERHLMDTARQRLQRMADNLDRQDIKIHIELGAPKYSINELAETIGADLIVVGSHGRHGMQLLLGSTANGVLHMAHCDVLAVRVGERDGRP